MLLGDVIRKFFFYQKNNGSAESTAKTYREILEGIPHQEIDIEKFSGENIQEFLSGFRHFSVSSRNQKRAALRSFFKWAIQNECISKDPTRLIRFEKSPAKEAKFLNLDQVHNLLSLTRENPRDHLIFVLLLSTGMRLNEKLTLNCGDVRIRESFLVIGKMRKSRRVFIPPHIQGLIQEHLEGKNDDSPLFQGREGRRLSGYWVESLFRQYQEKAGLEGFTPHSLRHTFASHLYAKTKELLLVSQLLGHSNIQTIMRYSHLTDARKREAVQDIYK